MQNVTDPQYDLEEVRKTQVERISLVNKVIALSCVMLKLKQNQQQQYK